MLWFFKCLWYAVHERGRQLRKHIKEITILRLVVQNSNNKEWNVLFGPMEMHLQWTLADIPLMNGAISTNVFMCLVVSYYSDKRSLNVRLSCGSDQLLFSFDWETGQLVLLPLSLRMCILCGVRVKQRFMLHIYIGILGRFLVQIKKSRFFPLKTHFYRTFAINFDMKQCDAFEMSLRDSLLVQNNLKNSTLFVQIIKTKYVVASKKNRIFLVCHI